ncbi:MAG: ABC transporter permease [Desulfobacteraceae bacterium]|nr:ABC transporter permease [Desulfobacteraceae bacterium]
MTWPSAVILGLAIVLSLATSALLLQWQDKPAGDALMTLFQGAFGSLQALEDCTIKAVPIFLCSLGVAVAFRLQVWNIGAEGQYAMGAIGATWVVLQFPQWPAFLLLPAMMAAAALAGGLCGLVPALLKVHLRANEIIVSLMLNYICILFLEYLVYGPWKDPVSFGFPMTMVFPPAAIVGTIGASRLNWGVVLGLACAVGFWVFFRFTRLGYELKVCGESPRVARYARLPYRGLVIAVMVAGGALAGWAGFLEASATLNRLQPSIVVGYGYTAIVVAWLARLNPASIAAASLLLAGLRVGVENLQLEMQVPAAFGGIMEGVLLLTVLAGGFFVRYQVRWRGFS